MIHQESESPASHTALNNFTGSVISASLAAELVNMFSFANFFHSNVPTSLPGHPDQSGGGCDKPKCR